MTGRGVYCGRVREAFFRPRRACAPGDAYPFESSVREGGSGSRIRLFGDTAGDCWTSLRYRVFGCPHLIAAADVACLRYEGQAIDAVRRLPIEELMATLEIPVEKTGRILLLEDAFRALADRACRN